jgi:hypothetical protein
MPSWLGRSVPDERRSRASVRTSASQACRGTLGGAEGRRRHSTALAGSLIDGRQDATATGACQRIVFAYYTFCSDQRVQHVCRPDRWLAASAMPNPGPRRRALLTAFARVDLPPPTGPRAWCAGRPRVVGCAPTGPRGAPRPDGRGPPPRSHRARRFASPAESEPIACRIGLDTHTVGRAIRPIASSRRNALFAGSDGGTRHWAVMASQLGGDRDVEQCRARGLDHRRARAHGFGPDGPTSSNVAAVDLEGRSARGGSRCLNAGPIKRCWRTCRAQGQLQTAGTPQPCPRLVNGRRFSRTRSRPRSRRGSGPSRRPRPSRAAAGTIPR